MRLPVLVALAAMPLCANSVSFSGGNEFYNCQDHDIGSPIASITIAKNIACTVPGDGGIFSATTGDMVQTIFLTGGGGEISGFQGATDGFDIILPGIGSGFAEVTYADHFRSGAFTGSVLTVHGNAIDTQFLAKGTSGSSWDVTDSKTATLPIVFGQPFHIPGISAYLNRYQTTDSFLLTETITVTPLDVIAADAPEPATWTVMAMGLVLLVGRRRKR